MGAHRIIFTMALPRPAMKKKAGAMKKAKAMKKVKVMKAMKKKAMKKSVIAKRKRAAELFRKRRLIAPRRPTLVAPFRSGRRHARLRARSWGGKTAQGRALYAKTKALYKA